MDKSLNKEKKWVQTWEKAGKSLREIKKNELRSENYYSRNRHLLNDMLHYAFEHRKIRLTSGLVEMQKYFKKYHSQINKLDQKTPGENE
ncbi:hypothetical protein JXQ31_08190 [candidate division KSB1 bacterium]|nr:hypothetical protein [candidate division KSB1 bacterium]